MGSTISTNSKKTLIPLERTTPYDHPLYGGKMRPCITCGVQPYFKYRTVYSKTQNKLIVTGIWKYNCTCNFK